MGDTHSGRQHEAERRVYKTCLAKLSRPTNCWINSTNNNPPNESGANKLLTVRIFVGPLIYSGGYHFEIFTLFKKTKRVPPIISFLDRGHQSFVMSIKHISAHINSKIEVLEQVLIRNNYRKLFIFSLKRHTNYDDTANITYYFKERVSEWISSNGKTVSAWETVL